MSKSKKYLKTKLLLIDETIIENLERQHKVNEQEIITKENHIKKIMAECEPIKEEIHILRKDCCAIRNSISMIKIDDMVARRR